MNDNANQPAFPTELATPQRDEKGNIASQFNGLTKREYFAAMAIASGSTPKDAILRADETLKLLKQLSLP